MPRSTAKPTDEDVIVYAEEMIVEAIRTGTVDSALALECVYYAAEPDLVAALRTFSRLDSASRAQLMSYARTLAGQSVGDAPEQPMAH